MTGDELKALLDFIKSDLEELRLTVSPITLADLTALHAKLQAEFETPPFAQKSPDEQQRLIARAERLRQSLSNFSDGPIDRRNPMYKEYASRGAVWALGLLSFLLTAALIVAICWFWRDATQSVRSCSLTHSSESAQTSIKPSSPTSSSLPKPPDKQEETPASNAGKASESAGPQQAAPKQAAPKQSAPQPPPPQPAPSVPEKPASIAPSAVTLTICDSRQFTVTNAGAAEVTWIDPPVGSISQDGLYVAPSSISGQQSFKITARIGSGAAQKSVESTVTLIPPGGPDERNVLIMITLMGALGGCLHWISSFVIFVGNRQLLRSWTSYYLLMPIEGSALAVILYLLLRVGVLAPNVGSGAQNSTAALNTIGLYAFAGLAGIFSKQALQALGEVFNTIFKKVQAADPPKGQGKVEAKEEKKG